MNTAILSSFIVTIVLAFSSSAMAINTLDLNSQVPTGTFSCRLSNNPLNLKPNSSAKVELKNLIIPQYLNVLWKQPRIYVWLAADNVNGTVYYEGMPSILMHKSNNNSSLSLSIDADIKLEVVSAKELAINFADGTKYSCK